MSKVVWLSPFTRPASKNDNPTGLPKLRIERRNIASINHTIFRDLSQVRKHGWPNQTLQRHLVDCAATRKEMKRGIHVSAAMHSDGDSTAVEGASPSRDILEGFMNRNFYWCIVRVDRSLGI